MRSDWEIVKDSVMAETLAIKVRQHPNLGKALLETGNAELVEHTENDSYWGDGGDGSGKNMLGKSWMNLRTSLYLERCDSPLF